MNHVSKKIGKIRRVLQKYWRKFKRNVLWPVGFFVFAVIFVLLTPILIPIAALSYEREQKRMYTAADKFRCNVCGVVLGKASIEQAEVEWLRYVDELHRQNPGYHFRLVRTVHAICTQCGKPYSYCEKTNRFIETQMPKHRF